LAGVRPVWPSLALYQLLTGSLAKRGGKVNVSAPLAPLYAVIQLK
jgi:hypothetical protein